MGQVLSNMMVNGSLGYWSHKTMHSSYRRCNGDYRSSGEEFIEVSSGEESRGYRYIETSHSSSIHCVVSESRGNRSQDTSHSN